MFIFVKPPQHIPRVHTHTAAIVFSKASLSHTESEEVVSLKTNTHTPAVY